ncbi:MAG: hypothetical protein J6V25_09990 [Oscillospiraceae bacterium]|nr:hypothetical protein [Oscillospiraceae bacterium]
MEQMPQWNQLIKLAQSPAGKQLLQLLQQQGGNELQQVMELAAAGKYDQAKAVLSGILSTPEAQKLRKQLEEIP